jgi:hypothetical protein
MSELQEHVLCHLSTAHESQLSVIDVESVFGV